MPPQNDIGVQIAQDFDDKACEFCERYRRSGLSRSSRSLMKLLEMDGLARRKLVDLGCGTGSFAIEAIKRGADQAFGVDLSPEMVKNANELALANGLQDKAKFEVGNAATFDLPPADIVTMDKVICCYPDPFPLLKNAIQASGGLVGYVVPRDEGLIKGPLRLGIWIVNFFERRRRGVQFYLHRLSSLEEMLKDAGFERIGKAGSRTWLILVYKRTPQ